MSLDPTQVCIFNKSIIISNSGEEQTNNGTIGQLRFNQTTLKFEGYHSTTGADIFGNIWRPLTQDVATTSNLGVFRVGNNLTINPTTGILSSIATGVSRIYQLVITVSPILGAADYQTINTAISNAIGTPSGGYIDGSITSIIGSAPSSTYPFIIQLSPGQYNESLNKIILPDYVSLRGEDNYNSVITQNTGNVSITSGSMIVVGQNCEIRNLVVKLADNSSSPLSNAIYSLNNSNVVIDNCIFTCNTNISTTANTSYIYMNGGSTNNISNCQFLTNSSTLTGVFTCINIISSTPRIINNKIDTLTPNTTSTFGISIDNNLTQWNETESIIDKTYIENMTLSSNYYNTITSNNINTAIYLNNSPIILKNSDIEVSTNQSICTNYGLQFDSSTPLINTSSTNILSFANDNTSNSIINSNNTGTVNFVTLGFQRGQYISVSGSQNNDGVYRIYTVLSSSSILLDTSFQLINEIASSNTIVIKALYDVEIFNSKINALSNYSIFNNDSNSNYVFNINNLINESELSISPSKLFYTNYKTIRVGKTNCDYTSLQTALNSISDNNSNTRYNIKVESGIYQELSVCICKEYVNIEGNGQDNTTILFNQASDTSGTPFSNTSCFLISSNMSISNLTIRNASTLYTNGQTTTTVLYNNASSIINFTLENIIIDSTCKSVYNTGIYLDNTGLVTSEKELTLRNVSININSILSASTNIGIYASNSNNVNLFNVSINTQSSSSSNNYAISVLDSEFNIYNSSLYSDSASVENLGIKTNTTNLTQKLIQIYNGQIRVQNGIDYSIYADNYYTIICNGVQILGDTYTNTLDSRIFCSGCYSFNNSTDKVTPQSLNSRGQNEQNTFSTLTIGDTAGKLNSTGIDNVLIGVNAGSNVTTAAYTTILGANAGNHITTANNNTLLGANTGNSISTGSYNTITGSNVGTRITTGTENIITGYNSGNFITTGSKNTIVGTESAQSLTTGNLNVFVGDSAGINTISSNTNTFIGSYAGITNQTGNDNTYIGYQSGNASISANDNTMIGRAAGYNNLSDSIVAIGNYAGYNNISNIKNTYLGTDSGYNNTTGDGNTYLGKNSGYSAPSASGGFNTAIGNEAGYSITSGSRNVLLGSTSSSNGTSNDSAGWSLSSGNDNVHIGVSSGNNATSAANNVLIGSSVGTSIVNASNNVLIGKNTGNTVNNSGQNVIIGTNSGNVYNAGNGLIVGYNAGSGYTGSEAFALGYQAGANITGDFNMFMGYNSGGLPKVNTTGAYNIAIGPYTGFNLSSGTRNVIIGSGDSGGSAGKLISTGSDNTLVGFKAGSQLQAGGGNTLFGSNAGANLTSGIDNLVLGYQSAFNLNSGSYNVVLGPQAGYNLNNGISNIYSGYQSGYHNTSGSYNINMGYQSGFSSVGNNYNIHLGHQAGYKSEANNNLFLGYKSGLNNTFGTNNIFIGSEAGSGVNANSEQIGVNNIFVGTQAGYSNDNGSSNIFMGANAGESSIDGSKNIFIGENAGSTGTTSHNIFIGNASSNTAGIGYLSTGIGENNVFIGSDVGIANTTGNKNIFLGDQAGMHNVDGVENIYIGTNAGQNANATAANYNIAIGSDAGINNLSGTENILIGRQVAGLTTSTNYNQNIIIGTDAGQNIQQNNQIFIGTNAGKNNTTGDRNIFIGLNAGQSNIISPDNVIIGSNAGTALVGDGINGDNVLIGAQAGQNLDIGTNNIYIGSGAGTQATTSINNVVIGANAMNEGNANNVIVIGHNAGLNNATDTNIFIGSNAGVENTTGGGNIFVGYESGYNVNSNGNIIFGNQTVSSGQISDNNIILGNETAKNVVNKANFANNIIMGPNAGKTSSLSINSIIIGSDALNTGTGGEDNIIMGNNTATNLGNQNPYYAITTSNISVLTNSVYINIPFGTGGYYFKTNDFIIIESLNNNYVFQTQIILIDFGTGVHINTTKLVFNTKPSETIPIGSLLYSKNIKANEIGHSDFSKSSSNMCIGDQNGFSLTTGSKNASIGDNAMHNNKVGRYNITLGTESGYNLNTDNNLCLGINSGYSLDSYKNTTVVNDFIFYQSNNTIKSTSTDFSNYIYGTVFDIDGSSSNDSRFYVKGNIPKSVSSLTEDQLVVQGFPYIIENGIQNTKANYIIKSSKYKYINSTVTSSNIYFIYGKMGGDDFKNFIRIGLVNPAENLRVYNIISTSTYVTAQNSKFNDGVKLIDTEYNGGILLDNYIYIPIIQNSILTDNENTNIILTFNNIVYPDSISGNSFNGGVFSGDNLNAQIGLFNGLYKLNNENLYFLQSGNPRIEIKGANITQNLVNGKDSINQVYTNSLTLPAIIPAITYYSIAGTSNQYLRFRSETNTIQLAGATVPVGLIYMSYYAPPPTYQNLNNNKYFYVTRTSFDFFGRAILYIDKSFPVIDETINFNALSMIIRTIEITNVTGFNQIYNTSPSFAGNIVRLKYRTNLYQNYVFGTYVLECFYKDGFGLNDKLLNFSRNITSGEHTDTINLNITLCDNGFKTKTNDYISSIDLTFQTSNITLNNITFDSTLSTITSTVNYEFIDIIAPVMIKISGTLYNNGFYLVSNNPSPFNQLTISANNPLINETISNVNFKSNSISSYFNKLDLSSYLQLNKEYTIFGSKYNDEKVFKLYTDANATSNSSVYLSDDSNVINDSSNDFYYSIVNNPASNTAYSTACNRGVFQHYSFTNMAITIINSKTIQFTDPLFELIVNDSYLKISNTPAGAYDGLYWIKTNTLISFPTYQIEFNTKYERNGIIYTTPDPFSGATFTTCDVLSNQFIFNSDNMIVGTTSYPVYNLDWVKVIDGFGENAKYLSFTNRDGSLMFIGGGYNPSPLFGAVSSNPLTFEVDSFALNCSNIAVSLIETCPGFQWISFANYDIHSYIISLGVPNPSTTISNIYRKNTRPLFYNNFSKTFWPCDGYFDSVANSITVQALNIIYYPYSLYGKNSNLTYDFKLFAIGQVLYIFGVYYLIKSISSDFLTVYFDSNYSVIPASGSANSFDIFAQYGLTDTSLNFNLFNPSVFPDDYQMMVFKHPTSIGLKTDGINFIDDKTISELYFPINAITKTSNSTIAFDITKFNATINPATNKLQELAMNNTIISPSDNIITNYTNMSFHNQTVTGSSDISFYASNNTITSISTDLSQFIKSEYILISNTINNNFLYRINDAIIPTSNSIIISSESTLVNELNKSATLKANNINSSNITITDLSMFGNNQKFIISRTDNNNFNYFSNTNSISSYSIYIDNQDVITEIPNYCSLEKLIIIDEVSSITGSSNINFNGNTITVSNNATDLSNFRTEQTLSITGTSNNNVNYTISNSIIPSNVSITVNETTTNEINQSAILKKQINFNIIGEPLQTIVNSLYSSIYHYEDSEGNNSMIGSFAGYYIGTFENSIYNVVIGSRCAQVNHGSGNIFIGNESKLALNATDNYTTFNNKLAIYKNNTTGVPQNPLIGGDFASGRVGINTISPEAFNIFSDITLTDTKLVVNGGAIANSYSPFTGCHIVNFANSNIASNIEVGMIVSTTGEIIKKSAVNTYCTVDLSKVQNDKRVFGVYAFSENSTTNSNEYIINNNNEYIKNPEYNADITTLYYAAALGEGCILISNYGGEIQNGDYITTCPIAGYGSLQSDDILHSYTVAKCTETIDWSSINETIMHNGTLYKIYLTGCTYHCG